LRIPLAALRPYIAVHLGRWRLGVLALLSAHLIEIGIPHFLKVGVDRLASGHFNVTSAVLAILLVTLVRYTFSSYGRRANAEVSVRMAQSLRTSLYGPLQSQGHEFWRRHSVGDMMNRMTSDVEAVRRFFRFSFNQIVGLLATTVVAPWFMLSLSARITIWVAPLFIVTFGAGLFFAARIRKATSRVQSLSGNLSQAVLCDLQGIRTLQTCASEELALRRVAVASRDHVEAQVILNQWQSFMNSFMQAAAAAMAIVAIWQGGSQVAAGKMSVGALSAFLFYLGMVLGLYTRSAAPIFAYLSASSAVQRLEPLLEEHVVTSSADSVARRERTPLSQGVTLHKVSFSYSDAAGASRFMLEGIDLTIQAGETIVLMGPVGAGKSTLLRLLVRQLEIDRGLIEVDGIDITDCGLPALRQLVTLVTQDSHLFSSTVANNIAFDEPDRPAESIWHSASLAALAETIEALPDGMKTLVGERGVRLSGGQKQRTLIARGLIRRSPVLLLDDTFSALDMQTEAEILQRLRHDREGLITLIVSHRASAAEKADRVILLDRGRLVDMGTHAQLLSRHRLYRRLCSCTEPESVGVA
jgi:ATP-binding cassette subfamily B protein